MEQTSYPGGQSAAVVVVTALPGSHLVSSLQAFSALEHEVAVLVVDDCSDSDPSTAIAAAMPGAFISRLETRVGFGAAVNHGVTLLDGADWLLLCHDDVALAPDALALMMQTAEQEGADVVVPKLVDWLDHERIRSIGFGSDRSGRSVALAEAGDLDQGQHDSIRPVAGGSSSCLLIRTSLFRAIGGYDESMTAPLRAQRRGSSKQPEELRHLAELLAGPDLGEGLDLVWRAIAAGGKAIVVPDARVAHGERVHSFLEHEPLTDSALAVRELLTRRNQVRTVSATLSVLGLLRAIPSLFVQWVRLQRSALPISGVKPLIDRTGFTSILARRRVVRSVRTSTRSAQSAAGARSLEAQLVGTQGSLRKTLKAEVAKDSVQAWTIAEEAVSTGLRRGPGRIVSVLFAAVLVALLFGSRGIFSGPTGNGSFVEFGSAMETLRAYSSTWRDHGSGYPGAAPPGLLSILLFRVVTFGSKGLAQVLSSTGLLFVGVIGVSRLAATVVRNSSSSDVVTSDEIKRMHTSSLVAATLAAAMYGATPVGVNAIRSGSWEALLVYGALPWILHAILKASGELRGLRVDSPSNTLAGRLLPVMRVAVPLVLLASLAPVLVFVVVVVIGGLTVGGLMVGSTAGSRSELTPEGGEVVLPPRRHFRKFIATPVIAFQAIVVTLLLWVGFLTEVYRYPALFLGNGPRHGKVSVLDIARLSSPGMRSGLFGVGGWLTVGLFLAALSTLLLVNGGRLNWAIRFWTTMLISGGLVWAIDRGDFAGRLPSHEVLYVPIALSLAVLIALGVAGVATDIGTAVFGWRQFATLGAGVSVIVATLPLVASSFDGRWNTAPRRPAAGAWMAPSTQGGYRTLWIGSSAAAVGDGSPIDKPSLLTPDQLRFAVASGPELTTTDGWIGKGHRSDPVIAKSLRSVLESSTFRLGEALNESAIRYVIVVKLPMAVGRGLGGELGGELAGLPAGPNPSAEVQALVSGLDQQLDLSKVETFDGLVAYENRTWTPQWSVNGAPVFTEAGRAISVRGNLPAGELRVASAINPGWRLAVDGTPVSAAEGSGEGPIRFAQPGGSATVTFMGGSWWAPLRWLQLLLWVGASVGYVGDWRRRRRRLDDVFADALAVADPTEEDETQDFSRDMLTLEGAFRSDEEVFAAALASRSSVAETAPPTSLPQASLAGFSPATVDLAEEPRESLSDQLWSEWTSRRNDESNDAPGSSSGSSSGSSTTGSPL